MFTVNKVNKTKPVMPVMPEAVPSKTAGKFYRPAECAAAGKTGTTGTTGTGTTGSRGLGRAATSSMCKWRAPRAWASVTATTTSGPRVHPRAVTPAVRGSNTNKSTNFVSLRARPPPPLCRHLRSLIPTYSRTWSLSREAWALEIRRSSTRYYLRNSYRTSSMATSRACAAE